MFAPAAFSFILVLTLACMLAFYALLALLSRRSLLPRSSLLPPLESEEWQEEKEQVRPDPFVPAAPAARRCTAADFGSGAGCCCHGCAQLCAVG